MKLYYRRCAGLDVHQKSISACIRLRKQGEKQVEIKEAVFGTFTEDLKRLRDWLKEHKVKQIAMESTGVYWMPVWNVLEGTKYGFHLTLVNAVTVHALKGKKTDRIDAGRLAELLQYGLLAGSFVPPQPIRELRDLTRMRVQIQQDRNRVINRTAKLLETANCKLGSVVSTITGKTGQAILRAIVAGERKPEALAELAVGSLKQKKEPLRQALAGRYSPHFRWMLGCHLEKLEWLDQRLATLEAYLCEKMMPYEDQVQRLMTIPGVNRTTAWALIAELGVDMSEFPSAAHAASWAGLCPGNAESAGKRLSGRTRKGNRYLRRILVQSAWAVVRKRDCFLTALFYRTAQRRGMKKAAVAVAHRIVVIAYHILRDGTEYKEFGGDHFDRLHPERTVQRLTRRLENLGVSVSLTPLEGSALPARPKRGRPCKCAERGLPCFHPRTSTLPVAKPETPPIAADILCPKCRAWGIPCIHARFRNRTPNTSNHHADSIT